MQKIWNYYKGRIWCLRFHAPVIRCLGGYGVKNHFGRCYKAYHSMWCVVCDNRWDQPDMGEKCVGSHIWHLRQHEKSK